MSDFLCCGCMEHVGEGQPCSCGFDGSVYRTAPHHLIPGTLIRNRYVLGKVLGEGGFGITYVEAMNNASKFLGATIINSDGQVNWLPADGTTRGLIAIILLVLAGILMIAGGIIGFLKAKKLTAYLNSLKETK